MLTLDKPGLNVVEHAVVVNGHVSPKHKALTDHTGSTTFGIVSKKYGVIHNEDIIQTMVEQTGFELVHYVFNQKNGNSRMVFERSDPSFDLCILGDIYKPQIEVLNSYSGQKSVQVHSRVLRLACLNGMRVTTQDGYFTTSHTRYVARRFEDEVISAFYSMNDGLAQRIEGVLSKRIDRDAEIDDLFMNGILSNRQVTKLKTSVEHTLNPEHYGKLNQLVQELTGPFVPKGDTLEDSYYSVAQRAVKHLMVKYGK